MSFDFETQASGKWILAGEHAVLRGKPALVFPIPCRQLMLRYNGSNSDVSAHFEGKHGSDLHLLFWGVMEHGVRLLSKSLSQLKGEFYLENNIPIAVGMGASAALSVVVAHWFEFQGWLEAGQVFSFSKTLEDLFHGKSSGLDIIGVSSVSGMYFKNGEAEPLFLACQPTWCLSFCGQQGVTSHCIAKVNHLWEQDEALAREIDERMSRSVEIARVALAKTPNEAEPLLVDSLHLASSCFKDWGLVSETMALHMQQLLSQGALAVKPTGSGGGGYVLSLWPFAYQVKHETGSELDRVWIS